MIDYNFVYTSDEVATLLLNGVKGTNIIAITNSFICLFAYYPQYLCFQCIFSSKNLPVSEKLITFALEHWLIVLMEQELWQVSFIFQASAEARRCDFEGKTITALAVIRRV